MKTIIDLGCGTGNEITQYKGAFHLVGIDLDEENIRICKEKMPNETWFVGDVTKVSLEKYTDVEKVICTEVLEHVPEWKAGVKALSSVHSGATLFLTVPHEASEKKLKQVRPAYWDEIGHHHYFNGSEMKKELEKNEWTNITIKRKNAALYWELKLLFKRNAPCIRNTYYENNLPLAVRVFFQLFRKNLFQTKLKFIPLWLVTLPLARIFDRFWGATVVITATKK